MYMWVPNLYSEFHGGSRGDRSDRMELEQDDEAEMRMRIEELEQGNADMLEQNKDLREQITSLKVPILGYHKISMS